MKYKKYKINYHRIKQIIIMKNHNCPQLMDLTMSVPRCRNNHFV